MRAILFGVALSLCAAPAFAQSGPPSGGGAGGGGPGGNGGPPRGGPGGGQQPRPIKPVKREQLDKPVAAMFRLADRNRDGLVELSELQLVVAERRETRIRARFVRIDGDHDGTISAAEFLAWQRGMGSAASSEHQPVAELDGPVAETISPDLDGDAKGAMIARVIEPLSAMTIVNANTDYDAGMSLDELLAYERARFDRADADRNGELTMQEMRSLDPEGGRRGPGGPGFPGAPMSRPPVGDD